MKKVTRIVIGTLILLCGLAIVVFGVTRIIATGSFWGHGGGVGFGCFLAGIGIVLVLNLKLQDIF